MLPDRLDAVPLLPTRDLIGMLDAERLAERLGTADSETLDAWQEAAAAELDRRFPVAQRVPEIVARLLALAFGGRVIGRHLKRGCSTDAVCSHVV